MDENAETETEDGEKSGIAGFAVKSGNFISDYKYYFIGVIVVVILILVFLKLKKKKGGSMGGGISKPASSGKEKKISDLQTELGKIQGEIDALRGKGGE